MSSGLSSSAAFELAILRSFCISSDIDWDSKQAALQAQKAENAWVGVQCGIMDQLACSSGVEGHALMIDCRSLETQSVALPADVKVIIMNPHTSRSLVSSPFNERRRQCEDAARVLGVSSLRDVSLEEFYSFVQKYENQYTKQKGSIELPPHLNLWNDVVQRRALHVIGENERTLKAVKALQSGNCEEFGRLMCESHESLRLNFEVSTHELDAIVGIAMQQIGCYGARITGAGFGGCAVALVAVSKVFSFAQAVTEEYHGRVGVMPTLHVCSATQGASLVIL